VFVAIASVAAWQALRGDAAIDQWTAQEVDVAMTWTDLAESTLQHANEVLRSGVSGLDADPGGSAGRLVVAEELARTRLKSLSGPDAQTIRDYLDRDRTHEPPKVFLDIGELLTLQPTAVDLTAPRLFGELTSNGALGAELLLKPKDPAEPWMDALIVPLASMRHSGLLARAPVDFIKDAKEPEQLGQYDPDLLADLEELVRAPDMHQLMMHRDWLENGLDGPAPLQIREVEQAAATLDERITSRVDATLAKGPRVAGFTMPWAKVAIISGALALLLIAGAVTRQDRRTTELEHIAAVDPLTGIGNRRSFRGEAGDLLRDDNLEGHLVVAMDLDRFKSINDEHGHPVGDLVLQALATRTEAVLTGWSAREGASTSLARVGGDEFMISAHQLGRDRMRSAVELGKALLATNRDPAARDISFSTSIGMALTQRPMELPDLIEHADRALYAAKGAGGASVRLVDLDGDPSVIVAVADFADRRGDDSSRPAAASPRRR